MRTPAVTGQAVDNTWTSHERLPRGVSLWLALSFKLAAGWSAVSPIPDAVVQTYLPPVFAETNRLKQT